MSRDKITKLEKYLEHVNEKLNNPVPEKHKDHPETFLQFWNFELKKTTKKRDNLILALPSKKS